MRFADLLGEPDDDGSAPGTPAPAVPGAPASGADPAPPGASGSLGGSATADDELSRWFGPEDRAEPESEPPMPTRPTRAGAVAAATGAYEEPAGEEPSDATQTPTGASAAVTSDGSRTRDDLLPPRRSGRGRRGR